MKLVQLHTINVTLFYYRSHGSSNVLSSSVPSSSLHGRWVGSSGLGRLVQISCSGAATGYGLVFTRHSGSSRGPIYGITGNEARLDDDDVAFLSDVGEASHSGILPLHMSPRRAVFCCVIFFRSNWSCRKLFTKFPACSASLNSSVRYVHLSFSVPGHLVLGPMAQRFQDSNRFTERVSILKVRKGEKRSTIVSESLYSRSVTRFTRVNTCLALGGGGTKKGTTCCLSSSSNSVPYLA